MKTLLICALSLLLPAVAPAEVEEVPTGSFRFEFTVAMPGSPEEVFDAATGDVSGWWDHSMSGDPIELTIEPRPGGHFLEIMDEQGGGVVHATVIQAQRGKLLRMHGPMGLAGFAVDMVTTWTLEENDAGGTDFHVEVHAAGEIYEDWGELVEKTWRHFIEGRLLPHLEAGRPR